MVKQKERAFLSGHYLEAPEVDTRIDIEVLNEEIVEYTTSEEEQE